MFFETPEECFDLTFVVTAFPLGGVENAMLWTPSAVNSPRAVDIGPPVTGWDGNWPALAFASAC